MELISVHLAELTLKGKNRGDFEKRLVEHIKAAIPDARLKNAEGRLLLETADADTALARLKKIFGISWFSKATVLPRDTRQIAEGIAQAVGSEPVKIETRRVDKKFPKTSLEISKEIAELLAAHGKNPAVKNYEKIVLVEMLRGKAIATFGRTDGLGGLPYGSSGKLLALLSGGIDSPVAAWLMMGRGCGMELLHVHAQPSNEDAKNSKIAGLARALAAYSPKPLTLHVAPYDEFYKVTAGIPPREELVVFRRFILRLADEVAKKSGALGIVTGDSVGQVASQTLHNLAAVSSASELPVYRPLVGMDKEGIIKIAKSIGTYEISIKPYKDCCSLVAEKHPSTKVKIERAEEIEKEIRMKEIVEKTIKKVEAIPLQ